MVPLEATQTCRLENYDLVLINKFNATKYTLNKWIIYIYLAAMHQNCQLFDAWSRLGLHVGAKNSQLKTWPLFRRRGLAGPPTQKYVQLLKKITFRIVYTTLWLFIGRQLGSLIVMNQKRSNECHATQMTHGGRTVHAHIKPKIPM